MLLRVSCKTFQMMDAERLLLNTTAEKRPKHLRLLRQQTVHTEIKNKEAGCKRAPWDAGTAEDESLDVSHGQNHCKEMSGKSAQGVWEEEPGAFLTLPHEFRTISSPSITRTGQLEQMSMVTGQRRSLAAALGQLGTPIASAGILKPNSQPQLAARLSPPCCGITLQIC